MTENKLKDILISEGITQAELARKSGVAQGSVNRFVNNNRNPSPVTKNKLINGVNQILGKEKYEVKDVFPN